MTEQDLIDVATEAEQSLLGALLIERDAMPEIAGRIVVDAFLNFRHQILFKALLSLWDRRVPADLTNALAEVRALGYSDRQFPADYLAELIVKVPSAVHVAYYAERVMQFAKRRALSDAGTKLVRAAYGPEEGVDTGELVAMVRQSVAPFEQAGDGGIAAMADLAEEKSITAVQVWNGERHDPVITTGLRALDRQLAGGFRPGQLVMVGARPGMGKTALMLQLSLRNRAHLVSLEMSQDEMMNRMVALVGRVPYGIATDPLGSVEMRNRWLYGADAASKLPITMSDRPKQTTLQIESDVARMVAESGTEIVIIDHLDWLGDKIKTDSPEVKTAELVRRCKAMARACNIPVVVLAQLNRNVDHRPGCLPHLSDFRNSGAIEQDADVALLLYRRRYYSERGMLERSESDDFVLATDGVNIHKAEVIVAKNRNGGVGTVALGWRPEMMSFEEVR